MRKKASRLICISKCWWNWSLVKKKLFKMINWISYLLLLYRSKLKCSLLTQKKTFLFREKNKSSCKGKYLLKTTIWVLSRHSIFHLFFHGNLKMKKRRKFFCRHHSLILGDMKIIFYQVITLFNCIFLFQSIL